MSEVTRILSAIEQGDRRRPSTCCRWSTTNCAGWLPSTWPTRSRGKRYGHRPGPRSLPPAGRQADEPRLGGPGPLLRCRRGGHAAHPGRERPPQAEPQARRRPGAAGTARGGMGGRPSPARTCSPWTRRWTGSRPKTRSRPTWSSSATSPACPAQAALPSASRAHGRPVLGVRTRLASREMTHGDAGRRGGPASPGRKMKNP